MRAANALRGLLERGADGLPERERPLFLGFVLGDTRGQPVDIADDFRGAGLSHLLAVSGLWSTKGERRGDDFRLSETDI